MSLQEFGAVTVLKASDFHGVSMASLHQHLLALKLLKWADLLSSSLVTFW